MLAFESSDFLRLDFTIEIYKNTRATIETKPPQAPKLGLPDLSMCQLTVTTHTRDRCSVRTQTGRR